MAFQEQHTTSGVAGGASSAKRGLPWTRSRRLERDLEHVNREIYRRNLELAQTNKTLALLQAIDSLVLNADDELGPLATKLSQEVVRAGYPFVAILSRRNPTDSKLETLGWAASDAMPKSSLEVVTKLTLKQNLHWFDRKDVLKFVNLGALTDEQLARYCGISRPEALKLRTLCNLKLVSCIKLKAPQHLVGVMVVGFIDHSPSGLNEFDKMLFMRLSDAVGIALDHKMLLDENERVVGQLKTSNAKLRALDRTKDDFISMASHQLRTPLTSVKGYVSMVLDGDGGKVNSTQRKLLTQSFLSAQRMVYLISDLLNVSRLKTGKFIIEPVPTDLAKVIEEEVEQLSETVKSRKLELTFRKPKDFPMYLLDETKIRQVMMNFIDNAVYYTPSGGKIEVNLVEKPQSIEFTVVDNGIGVPRHEQHHLFSKFYRAHNAKRARPDGTGLGLFMAKKVIIAQGGSIVFKSAEGKGSTFGFIFPKSALTPSQQPGQ